MEVLPAKHPYKIAPSVHPNRQLQTLDDEFKLELIPLQAFEAFGIFMHVVPFFHLPYFACNKWIQSALGSRISLHLSFDNNDMFVNPAYFSSAPPSFIGLHMQHALPVDEMDSPSLFIASPKNNVSLSCQYHVLPTLGVWWFAFEK